MKKYSTDVCIVGAGPGGCTTAMALAQQGVECILVDKGVFPRHKACGEVITSNCIRELASLDRAIFEEFAQSSFAQEIVGNTFIAPNQHKLDVDYHSPSNAALDLPHCYAASRYEFDNFLVQSVKRRYPQVRVMEGVNLSSFETNEGYALLGDKQGETEIQSRLVIFANGVGNALTKKTTKVQTLPSHEAVGIRAYFKDVLPSNQPDKAEFYFFDKKHMPYGVYITPLPDGMVNVNGMMRKDILQKKEVNLKNLILGFLQAHPTLKERFKDSEVVGQVQGCSLELGSRWWEVSGNRFLLVGDAAGLIDATNANGIGHAMISGKMAADFAQRSIAADDFSASFLNAYDKALRVRMQNALKLSRMVSPFFSMPFFSDISSYLLNYWFKRSGSGQSIVKIMYSKNTAKELLFGVFK